MDTDKIMSDYKDIDVISSATPATGGVVLATSYLSSLFCADGVYARAIRSTAGGAVVLATPGSPSGAAITLLANTWEYVQFSGIVVAGTKATWDFTIKA
jgi:hypothetical protein